MGTVANQRRIRPTNQPGNYIANDLTQVSTGSVRPEDQAARVVAEVCGLYPEEGRNEAVVNAGVLALTRQQSPRFVGFASAVGRPGWYVADISQEHGVLRSRMSEDRVEDVFRVGDKLPLYVSHSGITAAAYAEYYVVDKEGVVREVWTPWKGW